MRDIGSVLEGRNVVLEALRRGTPTDRLFVLEGKPDGGLETVIREAKRRNIAVEFVPRRRLDQLSETGRHQGVIAYAAAQSYATVDEILQRAADRREEPFVILLDGITDPHNLGAIIRTANVCGAHGVITKKHQAAGLTATVAKASAGAIVHTPVAKVTNLARTIEELKERGLWFICADAGGDTMYGLSLTGPVGLVIGDEGKGVSELVKKHCDLCAAIPMCGEIASLNASVAAGVLSYEIVRQRMMASKGMET